MTMNWGFWWERVLACVPDGNALYCALTSGTKGEEAGVTERGCRLGYARGTHNAFFSSRKQRQRATAETAMALGDGLGLSGFVWSFSMRRLVTYTVLSFSLRAF